ncbi:MAG TPA: hypothetical protein VIM11_10805 [Tepidisphaeraceae bacterium]|jgi:hypothetical protein
MTTPPIRQPSDFDRFRNLTRQILTTPKAELVKDAPKKKPAKKK